MLLHSALNVGDATAEDRHLTVHVRNAITLEAISDATVELAGFAIRTSSAAGMVVFPIQSEPPWQLTVAHPAFESATATATGFGTVEVFLIPSTFGERIIVEADDAPKPAATTVLREQIRVVPGSRGDPVSVLKSLPGVANNGQLTPLSAGLIIRGSSPKDSKVLIDGFEIPLLYHFLGVQSVVPAEMIEAVELQPGGFGVEFGRASSGVVTVRSRAAEREWKAAGEVSFINASAFAQGPVGDKGAFAIAVRRSLIDAILPGVLPEDANLDFTAFPRYYDYQGRFDWALSDRLSVSAFVLGSDDAVKFLNGNDNPTDPALSGNFNNKTRFTRAIASLLYESRNVESRFSVSAFTVDDRVETGANRLFLNRLGGGFRNVTKIGLAKGLKLRVGAELDAYRWDAEISFPRPPREGDVAAPNFSYDELLEVDENFVGVFDVGAWVASDLTAIPDVKLTGGVRVDALERQEQIVAQPRVQAEYSIPNTHLSFNAAAGLYTRAPEDNDEVLQAELEFERAIQATVGAKQEFFEGMTGELTGYYSRRRHLVTLALDRMSEGTIDRGYVNGATGETYGAELLVKLRRGDSFGWVAYTLSRSERRDPGSAKDRLFDYDQTHNLVVVGSQTLGAWRVGGRFQLTTGRPYTPVIGTTFQSDGNFYRPTFGDSNSVRFDTQHQLDLRVDRSWDLSTGRISAFLDISNIYINAAAIDHVYNFDYSARSELKTLPILPSFGVRGEF